MSLLLPDVSEFQSGNSNPNWAGIKQQNGGAGICRISYGNGHLDGMFVANYTAMKNLNFGFIGVYQYLRAGQDATSQAKAFCNWMGPPSAIADGTVFLLDLEEGSGDQSGRANTWFSIVDGFYGLTAKPLNLRSWLYSYPDFTLNHGLFPIFASNRRTWIAAYSQVEPSIGHTLWQCNDGQQGANIISWAGAGHCDTSIYHGTLSSLSELGWNNTTTTPIDPNPPIEEDGMPTGTVLGKGIRQTIGWPASAVKQIVLHSDWEGVQKTPPVVQVRIMHMGSQPFDAGQIKVDETAVTTITNDTDCNGCSLTRIDDGPATVAFHTNP